jgi:hypothetical protein
MGYGGFRGEHSPLRLGYYAWKPLVICKALAQVEPGAILLFMDANLQKYQADHVLWAQHSGVF